MGYNTSSVSQYIDANSTELMASLVAGGNAFVDANVKINEGIKAGTITRKKFITNTVYYAIDGCSTPASGATNFIERDCATTQFVLFDGTCSSDIDDKLAKFLKAGADDGDFELSPEVVDHILAIVNRDVAKAAWQGGTASSNVIEQNMDGWLKRLVNTSYSASTFGSTAATFTSANAVAGVDALMATVPDALQDKGLILSLPASRFNALKVGLRNANYFNFGAQGETDRFVLPGYDNVTVKREDGLSGVLYGVLTVADAGDLLWNVDLKSDSDKIEVWYDKTDDKLYHRVKFSVGTEIAFPSQVGIMTISA